MFMTTGDLMDPETMSIREMCDAFEVTPRTLRFYESKELLFPIREGQKRLFTRRDRARLKLILRGKRFGFSLEEIRQLLELYYVGDQQETQLKRETQHPLTHGLFRQYFINQQGGTFGHPPRPTARAETATLTAESDQVLGVARLAANP